MSNKLLPYHIPSDIHVIILLYIKQTKLFNDCYVDVLFITNMPQFHFSLTSKCTLCISTLV